LHFYNRTPKGASSPKKFARHSHAFGKSALPSPVFTGEPITGAAPVHLRRTRKHPPVENSNLRDSRFLESAHRAWFSGSCPKAPVFNPFDVPVFPFPRFPIRVFLPDNSPKAIAVPSVSGVANASYCVASSESPGPPWGLVFSGYGFTRVLDNPLRAREGSVSVVLPDCGEF